MCQPSGSSSSIRKRIWHTVSENRRREMEATNEFMCKKRELEMVDEREALMARQLFNANCRRRVLANIMQA